MVLAALVQVSVGKVDLRHVPAPPPEGDGTEKAAEATRGARGGEGGRRGRRGRRVAEGGGGRGSGQRVAGGRVVGRGVRRAAAHDVKKDCMRLVYF